MFCIIYHVCKLIYMKCNVAYNFDQCNNLMNKVELNVNHLPRWDAYT